MIIIFVDHLGSVNLWVEHLNFLAVFGLRGGFEGEGGRGKGEGEREGITTFETTNHIERFAMIIIYFDYFTSWVVHGIMCWIYI